MKRMLCAAVMAVLLAGPIPASAAVNTYTDADSGFKLKTQAAWMEIGGKDFYGVVGKPDKQETSLNIVRAIPAAQVETATGIKFTTADFLKKFADLQVLERYQINTDKIEYPLFKPETYEIRAEGDAAKPAEKTEQNSEKKVTSSSPEDVKTAPGTAEKISDTTTSAALALLPRQLLDNSTTGIATGKIGKQPYVYLHFIDKGDSGDTLKKLRRPTDVQLAITSANNILYTVISVFPLPNLSEQKKRVEEATVFSQKKVRDRINESNTARVSEYIASRKAFLKGLHFFAPVKDTQPFGFDDALLGGRVKLPENWVYCQVNEEDKAEEIPLKLTFSAPWNGIVELMTRQQELEKAANTQDFNTINYQNFKEALLFASSRMKSKDTLGDLFAEPLLTQLVIERFLRDALQNSKVKEFADLGNIKSSADFNSDFGTVQLSGSGTIRKQFSFAVDMNALFTPKSFGMAAHIAKNEKDFSPEITEIVRNIQLIKEK